MFGRERRGEHLSRGQNRCRDDNVADEKSEVGVTRATQSSETAEVTPATTIFEAELAPGPSGAVEYGKEIDEFTAIARRRNGEDIVVRGDDTKANRARTYKIEAQVGPPSNPQFPHTSKAGLMALPHFLQKSRSPKGHAFYETDHRKARKKP
jgi:hypothetical protein